MFTPTTDFDTLAVHRDVRVIRESGFTLYDHGTNITTSARAGRHDVHIVVTPYKDLDGFFRFTARAWIEGVLKAEYYATDLGHSVLMAFHNATQEWRCACGDWSTTRDDEGNQLCDECDFHRFCEAPEGVTFYAAQFTGEPRAKCDECGLVWAMWDCVCELGHDASDHDVA